jgi:hypothetical protein
MSSKKCRWASCTILTHTLRQLYEHCLLKKQIRVNLSKHAFCETFKTQYVIIMYYSCSTVTRKHANRVIDCRDVISGLQTHDIGANPIWHQIWHLYIIRRLIQGAISIDILTYMKWKTSRNAAKQLMLTVSRYTQKRGVVQGSWLTFAGNYAPGCLPSALRNLERCKSTCNSPERGASYERSASGSANTPTTTICCSLRSGWHQPEIETWKMFGVWAFYEHYAHTPCELALCQCLCMIMYDHSV